jgi:SAM-dependent methyltransferase
MAHFVFFTKCSSLEDPYKRWKRFLSYNDRMEKKTTKFVKYYDANYSNFQTQLYEQIRREAFGEDIGQNSWLTAAEQDRFIEWLRLSQQSVLLEVACGSGGPTLRIAKKTGCSVVGIDIHEQAISAADSLAVQYGLKDRSEFLAVNAATRLPFPDNAFHAISCIDAINHLPDRNAVIAEWSRILKPAGRLLFTDPITVTGPLTAEEISIRSSIGFFLFVPPGIDERAIQAAGLRLIWKEDVTENMATLAERRLAARDSRSSSLREVEGDETFEGQQLFYEVAAKIARERRLSRFVYVAEK